VDELVGKGRFAVSASEARGGVLTTTGLEGAERKSAGPSTPASVRDHVPVVHGDAAKCAKMDACVDT
jgi:hypothetical protein